MSDLCEKCKFRFAVHEVLSADRISITFVCETCLIEHFPNAIHWGHISWQDSDPEYP